MQKNNYEVWNQECKNAGFYQQWLQQSVTTV